jgi:ABC-type dipeptide/oligopeptide/nickel transport system permease component
VNSWWTGTGGRVLLRVLSLLFSLIIVLTALFVVFRIEIGVEAYVPKGSSEPLRDLIAHHLHANDSILVQYFFYIGEMLTGKGIFESYSATSLEPIGDIITEALPDTLTLFGLSAVLSISFGLVYQSLVMGRKSRIIRTFGSSSAFLLWVVPVQLVAVFFLMQVFVRGYWPMLGPSPEQDASTWERVYHQFQSQLFPILSLIAVTFGGFALMLAEGRARTSNSTTPSKNAHHPRLSRIAETMAFVMPSMKLNLAWTMSCVFVIEVMFAIRGLGFYSFDALLNLDLPLVEASAFMMIVIVLVIGFFLDLLLLSIRRVGCSKTTAPPPPLESTQSANTTASPGPALAVSLRALRRFGAAYLRSFSGMIGLIIVLGMAVLAIVGPSVAPPIPYWHAIDRDPVDAFLQVSGYSFLYALDVAALSLAIGVAIGLLSVVVRRCRYPIVVFAESLLSIPVVVVLVGGLLSLEYPVSHFWFILPVALVAWGPIALSFTSQEQRAKAAVPKMGFKSRFRSIVKSELPVSIRESLPDAISSLRFVTVIGTLSLFLFDYLFQGGSWGGMFFYALSWGHAEEFSLWWILPLLGMILLLGGFYMVLTAAADTMRKIGEESRPSDAPR